jgi:cytochrome c oxidase assembly protein subunit 15
MWALGYICRLPPAIVPSPVLFGLLIACLPAGGFVAGRWTDRGWRGGLAAGLLASVLNLMILGGLLSGGARNELPPSAWWWLPGSLIAGAVLGAIGAAVGSTPARRRCHTNPTRAPAVSRGHTRPSRSTPAISRGRTDTGPGGIDERNWLGAWAKVLVAATLLLLVIGGMVTGYEAGLSVVDWPNSFGYNMFLYPLSRMTGGVYYEHSHRLFGGLVGLTTLVLAVYIQRTESRAWLRRFLWLALLAVITQGTLGGLRVTGRFTLSTSPADTAPSIILAIVHGTVGQVFFAMTVAVAVFTSTAWKRPHSPSARPSAGTDRWLSAMLVVLLIVQLVFGAILRHVSDGLFIHLAMAVIVILAAVNCGGRAWGLYIGQPILQRIGRALLILAAVQVLLGLAAYVVAGATAGVQPRPAIDVLITTAHQATGALVLVAATMLMLWSRRLLVPEEATAAGAGSQSASVS